MEVHPKSQEVIEIADESEKPQISLSQHVETHQQPLPDKNNVPEQNQRNKDDDRNADKKEIGGQEQGEIVEIEVNNIVKLGAEDQQDEVRKEGDNDFNKQSPCIDSIEGRKILQTSNTNNIFMTVDPQPELIASQTEVIPSQNDVPQTIQSPITNQQSQVPEEPLVTMEIQIKPTYEPMEIEEPIKINPVNAKDSQNSFNDQSESLSRQRKCQILKQLSQAAEDEDIPRLKMLVCLILPELKNKVDEMGDQGIKNFILPYMVSLQKEQQSEQQLSSKADLIKNIQNLKPSSPVKINSQPQGSLVQHPLEQHSGESIEQTPAFRIPRQDDICYSQPPQVIALPQSETFNIPESTPQKNQQSLKQTPPKKKYLGIEVEENLKSLELEDLRKRIIQLLPQTEPALRLMDYNQLKRMQDDIVNEANKEKQALEKSSNKDQEQVRKEAETINPTGQADQTAGQANQTEMANKTEVKQIAEINQNQTNSEQVNLNHNLAQNLENNLQKNSQIIQLDHEQAQKDSSKKVILENLIKYLPQMKDDLEKMEEKDLYDLYKEYAKKHEKCDQKSKPNENKSTISKPNISEIKKTLKEKYPHLIKNQNILSDEQILKIFESTKKNISKKVVPPVPQNNSQQPKFVNKNLCNSESAKFVEQPLKRSHQTLVNQNISVKKKHKFSITQVREKLMRKLPQLKSNIMQLDDIQIEKIFNQSIQNNGKNKNSQQEPVITVQQPSHNNEIFKSNDGKTRILENMQKNKKKISKTIVLMHTEEDESQEEKDKAKRINRIDKKGKKCNCQCCQKNDIPELFKKIISSISTS